MKLKIRVGEEEKELAVTTQGKQINVHIDGQMTELELLHREGDYVVLAYEVEGERKVIRAGTAPAGDKQQIWVNGKLATYERVREQGVAADKASGSLSASIPAVVADVLVEVGDVVPAGEKLILLESMKMILPITAPHDGIVKAINCSKGDAVQPGVPLLELEA